VHKVAIAVARNRGECVSPYMYSHFAEHLGRCIYRGVWVGDSKSIENENGIRTDVVSALKKLQLPALRWPGGCFADSYHWQDGIGPREERPRRYNLWWHQPEKNEFGTDEFIRFCRMIGTEPYICVNVGSGTVEEARAWVEYCNSNQDTTWAQKRAENGSAEPFNVKFWGVGNENWGCGGSMRPEYYAGLYRRFATYMRATSPEIKLFACGSHAGIPEWDVRFLEGVKGATRLVDYLSLHIYSANGISDLQYSEDDYYRVMSQVDIMERNLERAAGLCRAYSTSGHRIKVVLDEWGTWFKEARTENGLLQQSTMLDAVFTGLSFHCFHRHAADLFMTNMAQTVNVLQALILTEGPKMCCTPTYYVYDMFKPHRGGTLLPINMQTPQLDIAGGKRLPAVSASATTKDDGSLALSLINIDLKNPATVNIDLPECVRTEARVSELRSVGVTDHNTPDNPDVVKPRMRKLELNGNKLQIEIAPHSVMMVEV